MTEVGYTDDQVGDTGDEIAIVGMAGRFPGAPDVRVLWRHLLDEVDSIRTYPPDELRAAGISEELIGHPGYVPAFGHLDGLDTFDAGFFGYQPAEAELIDPQQRLFLEESWTALEDAGYDPERYDGTIGVFAGAAPNRYLMFHLLGNARAAAGAVAPDDFEAQLVPGASPDYLPTRVSYKLGLSGPSVAVQTACSSSLVAVCTAAQNLRDYRCDLALAGGVAVTSTRSAGYLYREGALTAPDGVCRAFDAAAAGTVYGNGVAVLVLKRLEDALEDRDHVYAVLRGWAVTNDGADRAGFAAPGVDGQAAAIVEALSAGELEPHTIGYVEAHGTGTPVGDALEVEALNRAFAAVTAQYGAPPARYCALGSVKTNVGNLDAAAGAVGLVKAALAVQHGELPASLHFGTPHPEIDFAGGPFAVPTKTAPWPASEGPRRAGVSSFGQGGTNAHVVIEEPPAVAATEPTGRAAELLVLSARTASALDAVRQRLAEHLTRHPDLPLADVAYTLAMGRRPFGYRAAVVAASTAAAAAALRAGTPDKVHYGQIGAAGEPAAADDPAADPAGWSAERLADLGRRWTRGADLDWTALYPSGAHRRVPLPGYPFERQRHWIDPTPRGR